MKKPRIYKTYGTDAIVSQRRWGWKALGGMYAPWVVEFDNIHCKHITWKSAVGCLVRLYKAEGNRIL